MMGMILSVTTTLIAFTLAMLSRFSSKEHPKASRVFVAISVLNVLAGLISIVYASRSQAEQNKILHELNDAQQKLLTEGGDQLRVGSELAANLTKAQQTTERISSELSNNTRVIGDVLHQTERALEPLGGLSFLCTLRVPSTDIESANIVRFLEHAQRPNEAPGADIVENMRSELLPRPITSGLVLGRDSALFPKPNTALGALVDSVQVQLQFYAKERPPSAYIRPVPPPPDLLIDVDPGVQPKLLMITVPKHELVIWFMATVPLGRWGSTGAILSVRDLLRAQAVVQPLFSAAKVTDDQQRRLASDKWAGISVDSLVMYTGDGRRWALDTKNVKIVHAQRAPLFVGRFKGPVSPNVVPHKLCTSARHVCRRFSKSRTIRG